MKSICPKLTILLFLSIVISACQTAPKTADGTSESVPTDQASTVQLSSTEEAILHAFDLESAESWLEAAEAYQNLAENASQPERSSFYIRAALMFYYDGRHNYIEPFFRFVTGN
jgi:hypothetical protein